VNYKGTTDRYCR